jgi:hypothetical protein
VTSNNISDERLAALIQDYGGPAQLLGSAFGDMKASLRELQEYRELMADSNEPQVVVCPKCLNCFQPAEMHQIEALTRVLRQALGYVKEIQADVGDKESGETILGAAALLGVTPA